VRARHVYSITEVPPLPEPTVPVPPVGTPSGPPRDR
jgi:hypothetical protein